MTAEAVAALVDDSIGGRWSETNLHGVSLRERLLRRPERIEAVTVDGEENASLWLVLTECGIGENGYGIAFSEADGAFGLVQFTADYEPCLIGIYGTFWEAFQAM